MIDITSNAKISPQGKLNPEDIKRTIKNGLIYASVTATVVIPLILVFIPTTGERYVAMTALLGIVLKVATEIVQRLSDGPKK